MPNNNDSKSPINDVESSPIRNLFRKSEDSAPENSDNKNNVSINTDKKSEKKNTLTYSETSKSENKEISGNNKKDIVSDKSESDDKKENTDNSVEEKTSDKTDNEKKSEDIKQDNENLSDSHKNDIPENETDSDSKPHKQSVFGKFKSKIKEMVMSIKQPPEEYDESEIKDIFSSSGNFVREKNANPLDVDEEFKENVIYSAPKKNIDKDTKKSEKVISVQTDKNKSDNKKSEEKSEDTNEKDAFEIIADAQAEKNVKTEVKKPETVTEKSETKLEEKPKSEQPVKAEVKKSETATEKPETKSEEKPKSEQPVKSEVKKPETVTEKSETKSEEKPKSEQPVKAEVKKSETATEKPETKSEEKPKSEQPVKSEVKKPETATKKPETKSEEKPKSEQPVKSEVKKPETATEKSETKSEEKPKANKTIKPVSNAVKNNPLPPIPPKPKKWSDIDIPVGSETKNKDNKIKNENSPKAISETKPQKKGNSEKSVKDNITEKNVSNKETSKIIEMTPKKENPAPKKEQPQTENNDDTDKVMTYHYNRSATPFIIMAGKFTRTVRSEYEEIRKFNRKPSEDNTKKEETPKKKDIEPKNDVSEKPVSQKKISEVKPEIKEISSDKKNITENNNPVSVRDVSIPKKNQNVNKPVLSEKSILKNDDIKEKKKTTKKQPELTEVKPVAVDSENGRNIKKQETKTQKINKKKDKKKFRLTSIFDSEEEYDPDDNTQEIIEEKPSLDDYNEEKDADEIRGEINENFRHVFIRTIILLVATVFSVILSILAQCVPSLFNETIRNGWLVYAIINFIIFAVSIIASRVPIVNGLMPLRRFKGNSDTGIAVASFAVAIQSIIALFSPDIFVNGTLYIYTPLVVLALLLNSIGKMLIILRVYDNFRFLTKPNVKFAGKIYTDIKNAEKMTTGLPSRKPIIAYMKKSKFMSNFLKLSYAPDPSEDVAAKVAPFATLFSILCGVVYGIMTRDFVSGVSSFAISACITTPVCCLLAVNIPLKRLCRSSVRGGAMVTGYETVKQFCDTNVIMVDATQLYPKGSITLNGMKTFKESKINDAITSGAAIMFAVNGTMSYIFENIIQGKRDMLPEVDSVIYEDGMGLVGWVGGQRVLIGNRRLLESHNITPPEKDIEDRYRRMGNEITYISMGGELVAMFILAYNPNKEIIHELRNLEDNGVSFIVRTVDPNITQEHIAEKFSLFFRCIKILPTGLGNICHEVTSSVDDTSRAYLATRGKISSFARAISGCIRIKSNITLSVIIQYLAIIIGILLVTLISFISGFQKLGCVEMLLYMGFWILAAVIIPSLKK